MYKKIKLFLILLFIICAPSIGQIDGINQNRDFRQGFSIYLIAPAFVSGSESNLNPILRENGYPTILHFRKGISIGALALIIGLSN